MPQTPHIAASPCQHCGGQIEFDSDREGEDTPCPHCTRMTRLGAWGPPKSAPTVTGAVFRGVGQAIAWVLFGAALIALVCFVGISYPKPPQEASAVLGGLAGGIAGLALLILAITLVLYWIFFPWFVYRRLKEMVQILKEIRDSR